DALGADLARLLDEARKMFGVASRRERAGHREQHHLLALEQLIGGQILRPVLGHRLERARGHLVTSLDSHVPVSLLVNQLLVAAGNSPAFTSMPGTAWSSVLCSQRLVSSSAGRSTPVS